MKKFNFLAFVALLGLFIISCNSSNDSASAEKNKMSVILRDYKRLFNEGIDRFKQAECVDELVAIRRIYNEKLDDVEDRLDELTMGEEEKWDKILKTEFADERDEVMILEKKFQGIYDKRYRELE